METIIHHQSSIIIVRSSCVTILWLLYHIWRLCLQSSFTQSNHVAVFQFPKHLLPLLVTTTAFHFSFLPSYIFPHCFDSQDFDGTVNGWLSTLKEGLTLRESSLSLLSSRSTSQTKLSLMTGALLNPLFSVAIYFPFLSFFLN